MSLFLFCSDVDKIHDGIGDKVALLIQWLATFFGGFVVAFIREWRLTLLLLSVAPFLVIGGFFMSKVREVIFLLGLLYDHYDGCQYLLYIYWVPINPITFDRSVTLAVVCFIHGIGCGVWG